MCESKSTYLTDTATVFNCFTYLHVHVQWRLVKPDTFILNRIVEIKDLKCKNI